MRDPSRAMLWLVMIAFACVAFVLSAAADLEDVYPAEMFPTEVRASGVGIAAGISRIGAAISTFLLPICLEKLGIGPVDCGLVICRHGVDRRPAVQPRPAVYKT